MAAEIITLALAGGLGALCRLGLNAWVQNFTTSPFPWGTLVVNCMGCLLFGVIWALLEGRANFAPHLRLLLLVGFCGAFTTFSTFAFDNLQFIQQRQWGYLSVNLLGQNALGILCLILGTHVAKWLR